MEKKKKTSPKKKNTKKKNTRKRVNKKKNNYELILKLGIIGVLILIAIFLASFVALTHHHFKSIEIELGTKNISLIDFLKKGTQEKNSKFITDIDTIDLNTVGNYQIALSYDGDKEFVTLTVEDTTPPELEVKDIEIFLGDEIPNKDEFIVNTYDASGTVKTSILKEIRKENNIEYTIVAEDKYGNKTEKIATLIQKEDKEGPKFSGLTDISVKKNVKIDYLKGVSVIDNKDGVVDFKVDSSEVNNKKAGTYYAIYIASDAAGNVTTAKRKIVIDHTEEDTKELVLSIANTLSDDPEELRDYCRNKVRYGTSYGGDDPVWYAFKNHEGNCYVHALCFKALLDAKGIENQLIWVTNKTHYWNLVKIDGVWRHMDSTPDRNHRKISIMTDKQRLSTLSGRTWDTSLWPKAE